MHKQKRAFSLLLALAMVFSLLPASALAAEPAPTATGTGISGAISPDTENKAWGAGDSVTGEVTITGGTEQAPLEITVTGEVTVGAAITVSSGCVKFTGTNGTLKRGAGYTGALLALSTNATVTVTGLTVDGGAVWSGENNDTLGRGTGNTGGVTAQAALISVDSGATLNLVGSTLQENLNEASAGKGGAIYNNGGAVTLNKSTIAECQVASFGSAIYSAGGTVTLTDSTLEKNACTTSQGTVYLEGNAKCEMSGTSTISNNYGAHMASGVMANGSGSQFTLAGGTISGNLTPATGSGTGGGVYVAGGAFTMTGGTISGNSAKTGGGVYMAGGAFTMNGGTISGNTATKGGGIYVADGTVELNKGEIKNNSGVTEGDVTFAGGGITVANGTVTIGDGTLTKDGTPDVLIQGNKAIQGAGVMVGTGSTDTTETPVGSGAVTIKADAKISGNTATSWGGGVYAASGAVVMTGGEITNNSVTNGNGGGLLVYSSATVKLGGKVLITDNKRDSKTTGVKDSNVMLLVNESNLILEKDGLREGSKVGITTAADHANWSLVTGGETDIKDASDKRYFFDDAGTMGIKQDESNKKTLVWGAGLKQDVYVASDSYQKPGSDSTGEGTQEKPYATIGNAYYWVQSGGVIHVMNDLTMTSKAAFNQNKNVTILTDSNGSLEDNESAAVIKRGTPLKEEMFSISKGSVTLQNLVLDGGAVWKGKQPSGTTNGEKGGDNNTGGISALRPLIMLVGGAKLTLAKDSILQNNQNTAEQEWSTEVQGGAVAVNSSGELTMKDNATIRDNYTGRFGSAIYLYKDPVGDPEHANKLLMQDQALVTGNVSGGDYAAIAGKTGRIVMTGGSVTNNKALNDKTSKVAIGGIFLSAQAGEPYPAGGITLTVSGKVNISGNTREDTGVDNNVYLANGQTIAVGEGGLAEGSSIGVYTAQIPGDDEKTGDVKIVTDASVTDATYFHSDNAAEAGILFCDGQETNNHKENHKEKTIWLSIWARVKPTTALDPVTLEGSVTVNPALKDRKYALVDEKGAPLDVPAYWVDGEGKEHAVDYDNGWAQTGQGNLVFKPIPAGTNAKLVSVSTADTTSTPNGNISGDNFHVPTVVPGQLTGEVRPDGSDGGALADAYIHIQPTDPTLSYAVVDPTTGEVVANTGTADGWQDGKGQGDMAFGPLDPGKRYEIVAVNKDTGDKTPESGWAGKGTAITTPGVKDSTAAGGGAVVGPNDIDRAHNTPAADGKVTDKIVVSPTTDKLDYAIVDPETGKVVAPVKNAAGAEVADGWQAGADSGSLTFDGLDPNKKYEVVTRPHVTDGSIPVPDIPGTPVEKIGTLNATGYVKDKENKPVKDAKVRVVVKTEDGGFRTLGVFNTDANGKYTITGEGVKLGQKYTIYVDATEGTVNGVKANAVASSTQAFTETQPQNLAEILVKPNDSASGKTNIAGGAVSDYGAPVASAAVKILNKQTGAEVTPGGTSVMTTENGGGYTAENLPDGTYIVETKTADGKTGMTEIKVTGGKVEVNPIAKEKDIYKSTNVAVTPGGIVRGTVAGLEAGQTATVSLNVLVYAEDGTTVIGTKTVTGLAEGPSGANGAYWQIAGVPAGSYPVTVTTPKGAVTGTVAVGADGKVTTVDDNKPANTMTAASDKLNITVPGTASDKPNVITGVVVGADNKPVVGAKVTIYDEHGTVVGTIPATGAGGGYTLPELPDGKYYVSADNGGKNGVAGPIQVTGGRTDGKTTVQVSDTASQLLEGTVTKSDGATKAVGATVVVKDSTGKVIATTKTNADGQYFVGSVPASAAVSIVTPDGESADFTVSDAKNNQTGTASPDQVWDGDKQTAKADNAKMIIGPDGSKLPISVGSTVAGKAEVTITGPNGAADNMSGRFTTDANGNLVAKTEDGKPGPGAYKVMISDVNGMSVEKAITVDADGKISDSNPIQIEPHTISGTLKYESGAVPADAAVSIPGWGSSKVDPNGNYTLAGIPDGVYNAVVTVTDKSKNAPAGQTSTITVPVTVANGVPTFGATPTTPDGSTAADVTASGANLTVKPTTTVSGIVTKVTAAQTAVDAVPADKNAANYNTKLNAAISAVKAAQDDIKSATEEELKQLKPNVSQKLAEDLTRLLTGQLAVKTATEGVQTPDQTKSALEQQKGLLVDKAEFETAAETGKTVDVTLALKATDVTDLPEPPISVSKDIPAVDAVASAVSARKTALFDIVVEKTTVVTETVVSEGETTTNESKAVDSVHQLPTPLPITLPIPTDMRGLKYYCVLRVHNNSGKAERIPSTATASTVSFCSNLYSTYAILGSDNPMFEDDVAASPDIVNPVGPIGGGATTVKVEKAAGGKVKVDRPSASKGQTVVITVTPDPGYELDRVTVTDKNGNELALKDLGNGKYSFVMPKDQPVTVTATFRKTDATGDPHTNGVAELLIVDDHIAYMKGDTKGNFRPLGNITRAEVAQMFYNLLKDKNVSGGKTFTDVSADAWYADAVLILANLGIIEGVGEGEFRPDRPITRAEFVTMAMRFATNVTGEKTFTDVSADFWAHDYITGAAYYGWIKGYTDGSFKPMNPITRAEAATAVNNMLAREGDKRYVDAHEDLKFFPDVDKGYWAFYEIAEATNAHDFTVKDGAETWNK